MLGFGITFLAMLLTACGSETKQKTGTAEQSKQVFLRDHVLIKDIWIRIMAMAM